MTLGRGVTLATQLSVVLTVVVAVGLLAAGLVTQRIVTDAVEAEAADTVLAIVGQTGPGTPAGRPGGSGGGRQGGGTDGGPAGGPAGGSADSPGGSSGGSSSGGRPLIGPDGLPPAAAEDFPVITVEERDILRFNDRGDGFVPSRELGDLDVPTPAQLAAVPLGGPEAPPTAHRLEAPGGRAYMAAGLTGAPGAPNGDLLLLTPLDEAAATIDAVMTRLGLSALVLLAVGAILIAATTRWSMRPLDRITRTAGRLASGERTARVGDLDHPRDLATVATAFDEMAGEVEAAFVAQEAQEARLRQFIADASHELRTPLTAIRGHAEMFRMVQVPEKRERAMQRIESQAARMGRLVNDMLLLAELDGTAVAENDQPESAVDLVEVVAGVMDDLRAVQPARRVTVAAPEHAWVRGVEEELRRVVENVASNARKHTPVTAAVRAEVAVEEEAVVLTVADRGPGLPEGGEEKAFDRFWRSSAHAGESEGSSGLGLPIVAGLLARRGGEVELSSTQGEGVTVRITVPRWTAPLPPSVLRPADASQA